MAMTEAMLNQKGNKRNPGPELRRLREEVDEVIKRVRRTVEQTQRIAAQTRELLHPNINPQSLQEVGTVQPRSPE